MFDYFKAGLPTMKVGFAFFSFMMVGASAECLSYNFESYDFDYSFSHSFSSYFEMDTGTVIDDDIVWDTQSPMYSGEFGDLGGIDSDYEPCHTLSPTSSPMTWHTFSPSSSPTSAPTPSVEIRTGSDDSSKDASASNRIVAGRALFPAIFLFTIVANTLG